jgi:hypothetical protein
MQITTKQSQPVLKIRLNWKEYFKAFCEQHGGCPVKHRGVLLFRDGWRYSATDYAGPETPPPVDLEKRAELHRAYWSLRLKELESLSVQSHRQISMVRNLASSKSAALQHTISYREEEGKRVVKSVALNVEILEQKLSFLEQDIEECREHLRLLGGT